MNTSITNVLILNRPSPISIDAETCNVHVEPLTRVCHRQTHWCVCGVRVYVCVSGVCVSQNQWARSLWPDADHHSVIPVHELDAQRHGEHPGRHEAWIREGNAPIFPKKGCPISILCNVFFWKAPYSVENQHVFWKPPNGNSFRPHVHSSYWRCSYAVTASQRSVIGFGRLVESLLVHSNS